MQKTANYNLKKPENTDLYNVQDFSDNMETIDTALKGLEDGKATKASVENIEKNYAKQTSVDAIVNGTTPAGNAQKLNGFTAEEVGESGARNLIPYPYFSESKTISGITYTVNADGSITANGTATADSIFRVTPWNDMETSLYLPNGTYTLSGHSGTTSGGYIVVMKNENGTRTNHASSKYSKLADTFEVTDSENCRYEVQIGVKSGDTVENMVFKPMLERGSVAHDFVPYHFGGAEHALNADTVDGLHASDLAKATDLANYLPLDGSVPMSGKQLNIYGGYGGVISSTTNAHLVARTTTDSSSKRRALTLNNQTGKADIAQALMLRDIEADGTETSYTVLHSGNMADHALAHTGEIANSTADFNTYNTEGRWYIGSTNTFVNAPEGATQGWLEVIRCSDTTSLTQIWIENAKSGSASGFVAYRTRYGSNSWKSWAGHLPLDGSAEMTGDVITSKRFVSKVTQSDNTVRKTIVGQSNVGNSFLSQYDDSGNLIAQLLLNETTLRYYIDGVNQEVFHTGNSAKVVVSSTAPTDTNSLWIDNSNKKTKAYIDGAWTVIA